MTSFQNSGWIDMQYESRLIGKEILCTFTPDHALAAPVFCFSGMAPFEVVSGGTVTKQLGSYTEIQLPDLADNAPYEVTIRYAGGFHAANRAWLPLGPFLRVAGVAIPLPKPPSGCRPQPLPDLGPFPGLPLVPQPQSWVPSGGTLSLDGIQCAHPALQAVADLADRKKWEYQGCIETHVDLVDLPEDAYEIDITPQGITIRAGDYGGVFYAGITLLTLMQQGPLPCGTLKDAPRFGWRGQHLDTARHYYAPETIFELLDLMALLKMNRFHWHFADDEAFRLEIDCFPELWQQTAFCGEGHLLPGLFAGALTSGGSYSKDTARAILAHAKALNIEVMPEIEVPAHAIALTHVFPDLRDPDDSGTETSVQGYKGNVVNPAIDQTWAVLEPIMAEVGALFPFGHVHLGCDELPEGTWMGSPLARDLMAREGLKTTDDLQGWTIARLAAKATAHGFRPCAWEEAAKGNNGGIGNGALLFSWTGQGPGLAAARAGYDVVMSPAQHVYLDMAHTDDPDDWGANWAAYVSLADTIAWEPVPDPNLADRIKGVQGTFWSEFTTEDAQIWPMLMPRMLGVSAKAWQTETMTTEALTQLAHVYQSALGAQIWNTQAGVA
ncbi:beta-N-acetylhexosaminidase [Shimia sp. R10_1]|uniref:beta-N-acetylhexosaminidase n=1 Tax=Shimia sp. R10_1 TaxID=2821095 RepID=UPI001FFE131E|nr:beta-N-acetylhexosaminidase [Shimia sp. R10_1]